MTASEAIEILKKMNISPAHPFNDARNKAVEALEKQIPKEVISQPYFYGQELHCPSCNFLIGWEYERDEGYCRKCGQALDWSDT